MSSQQPPKTKSKKVEKKQGTLLSWVKPCTSGTEPGVVEETIRIKEQPESNCLANFPRTISQTSFLPENFGRKGTLSPADVFQISVIMQLSDMQTVVAIFLASISAIFTLQKVWNFQPFSLAL